MAQKKVQVDFVFRLCNSYESGTIMGIFFYPLVDSTRLEQGKHISNLQKSVYMLPWKFEVDPVAQKEVPVDFMFFSFVTVTNRVPLW